MLKLTIEIRDSKPNLGFEDGKLIFKGTAITGGGADAKELTEIFYGLLISLGYHESSVFEGFEQFVNERKHTIGMKEIYYDKDDEI